MRYTTGIPFLGWAIASFIASMLPTAIVVMVVRMAGNEFYGWPAMAVLGAFFVVIYIILAVVSTGSSLQLQRGLIIVGQRRKTNKLPLEIPLKDIDLTEIKGGNLWYLYALPQADEKYNKEILPVRQSIDGYYITSYKGLTVQIIRDYCRENGITLIESEWKWQQIEDVDLKKRSIKITYSVKRNFFWKENVVARHKDIRAIELVTHYRSPSDDHYLIHMHSGKSHEFGYGNVWYDEMVKYTERHGVPMSITKR